MLNFIKFIIPLISILFSSFKLGKMSLKKGYLEGIKLACVIIVLFSIIVLLFDKFRIRSIIYYFILFITSFLGAMIGINRKKVSS